jgi:NADP-dependent 3-hydroxy acid dehydrogenase YdfG
MTNPLIVITGASSGLGSAIATLFSKSNYSLALFARNLDAMKALNLPNVMMKSVDVTNDQALKIAIAEAEEKLGPVDCLINNAGVVSKGEFTDISHTDHQRMIDINLQGVINGIEAVLPGMQHRKRGTIINISSLADRSSRPNHALYAATKAAVKSLTESLRMANAKHMIRFCNVAPGKVHTPMWKEEFHPDHFVTANQFAEMILWIYQQPQTVCIRDIVITPTNYEP